MGRVATNAKPAKKSEGKAKAKAKPKAPRSIWNGWLSWGTVNVPVKLFSSVDSKSVQFNQLHAKDGARIKQKRLNPKTGEEVPFDRIVRGYEIAPGKWVVLTKEEAQAADGKRAKVIDIEDFVADEEIDPVYYDHPYYVGPQEGGEHAYAVVMKALERAGKVGVGRFVLRSREQLVALRPHDGILSLTTMRFHDEVVEPDDVDIDKPKKAPGDREIEMAAKLVESLSAEFEPTKYKDTYREAVLELIERKARGEEIELPEAKPSEAPDDLLAALEASLAGGGKS
ncbi:MAG: end-binding protein Ku [Thermoleophilales bacterium]|nr:end-binding protein Ku [Thermoleophilales bacterium]